jgi:hypothetical protein
VTGLTTFLFEKFVGSKTHPESKDNPDPLSGRFDRWSFFSLASAILNNSWTVLCTLLNIGVHPGTTSPPAISEAEVFFSGILLASTSYNPVMLAALLAFGASVHVRVPAPDGRTALHLACGEYFSVKSCWDKDGDKPYFAQHWKFDRIGVPQHILRQLQKFMIWILLECNHSVETPDYDGLTPLAYTLQHSSDTIAAEISLSKKPLPISKLLISLATHFYTGL